VSFDGTVPVQKLLSTIYRVDQRFAAGHVIDVLRGVESERIKQWHHDSLSVFGIGAERAERSGAPSCAR
jgi:ATP-dependent DNA helicase RecQ